MAGTYNSANSTRVIELTENGHTVPNRLVAKRWYCVHTQPRRETAAEMFLTAQAFTVFLPQFNKTVRHARTVRTVKAALFPRYLFVQLDLDHDRWRSINGTIGVSNLMTASGVPEPVPEGVVEILLASRDQAGFIRLDQGLRPGQRVRVVSGPLADAIGCLEHLDASGRVRVLLDIMGGKVPALLSAATLEPAA